MPPWCRPRHNWCAVPATSARRRSLSRWPIDFNTIVAVDVIWLETADSLAANVPALNVVDLASTFHATGSSVAVGEVAARAFSSGWLSWAGTPKSVLADHYGLQGQVPQDGGPPWHRGAVRSGAGTLAKWSLREARPELESHLGEGSTTRRGHHGRDPRDGGSSHRIKEHPAQWLPGSNGRLDEDEDSNALFGRRQALRLAAKLRVTDKPFEPGELVFYHRLHRPGKGKKPKPAWLGPATVIGRESSNYWLARGGKCILVAPEHIREAHFDEVNELLRVKMALHEIKRFVQNQDEQAFAEDSAAPLDAAEADIEPVIGMEAEVAFRAKLLTPTSTKFAVGRRTSLL